jgi:hypothetical protein
MTMAKRLPAVLALGAWIAASPAAAQVDADAGSRAVVDAAIRQIEAYYGSGEGGRSRAQECRESAQGLELDLLRDPRAILHRQRSNRRLAELIGPSRLPVPICFRPHVARIDEQVAVLTRFDSLLFARVPGLAEQYGYVLGFAQTGERDGPTLACDRAAVVLNRFDAPLRGRFAAMRWGTGLSDVQVRQRRVVFRLSPERLVVGRLRQRLPSAAGIHIRRSLVPCPG